MRYDGYFRADGQMGSGDDTEANEMLSYRFLVFRGVFKEGEAGGADGDAGHFDGGAKERGGEGVLAGSHGLEEGMEGEVDCEASEVPLTPTRQSPAGSKRDPMARLPRYARNDGESNAHCGK